MIIADNETAIDYLYYETVAKTVVKLIRQKSKEPLTIGLHGDWGAGKSSTLLMIESAFKGQTDTLCVRFNGWLFEGYDDAKAVLIETIVAALLKERSGIAKVADKAWDVLKAVNWMKAARTAGSLAFTMATGIPGPDLIQGIGSIAGKVISDPKAYLTGDVFNKVMDGAAEHFKEAAPSETTPQRMHAFREDFEELLERAKVDRLIVLIDDLDRCLPQTAIATLEAIRLFLFVPNAAFVIAADEGMIEYAVRNHFPDLPAAAGPTSYARNYLEKLIQVPFRMPALGASETLVYLTLLLYLASGVSDSSVEFKSLLEVARKALQRPWLGTGFDRDKIKARLGSIPSDLDAALQLAAEITPILTEGAHIKRFVNTMALRVEIASERGFQDDIKQSVLAKLMLAERFAPELFNAIARDASADGSKTISILERKVTSKGGKDADDDPMADWPNIEWVKRWAAITPPLNGIDLRPYVFVSRDRRTSAGIGVAGGPVEAMIERLATSTLGVTQVTKAEVAAPTPEDANRVFQGLVTKIDQTEDLGKRPPAAEGLARLCGDRPELREPLVAFLGRLPVSKIGGWVVSGWGVAVEGPQAQEFAELVGEWATQTSNKPLSVVASLQLNPKSKRK
ncbi:Qat anti-phage system ATPase QatA [Mesorhizobium sp.]|uniref:Qat anti-phage system ATPase QatA n=1 Tax=Mesorhizobium sp. TaxID=1871066 RepID=UPI000FE61C5E|nr:Qat anti-phage system ATPase QatA [Mesorhizobium sp.]RWJ31749.1 MAG: NTPase KAP [Mesorhizobium sp.]TIQ65531.1 MAG: NTPase KAP [Mesorhizobium sp.]